MCVCIFISRKNIYNTKGDTVRSKKFKLLCGRKLSCQLSSLCLSGTFDFLLFPVQVRQSLFVRTYI